MRLPVPSRAGSPPLLALASIFFLSGISGLMYQVLWLRLLSQVFGVTAYAASTVLASFMGGLAIGSLVAGRVADRAAHPLRWFALVELGIGASALLTPWLLEAAHLFYARVALVTPDNLAVLTMVRLACSAAVLIVPTMLMGATLPLIVRSSIVNRGELGPRVGLLYAANAGGAITGAVQAGFYLIGSIGIRRTFVLAASVNLVVAASAFWMARRRPTTDATASARAGRDATASERGGRDATASERGGRDASPRRPTEPAAGMTPAMSMRPAPHALTGATGATGALVLTFFALSGLASLALEVIWFRVLVLFLPATTYAFTTMLATVLGGIATGSAIATRLLRRERAWVQALVLINVSTAIAVLASLFVLTSTYQAGWRTSGTIQASIVAIFPSALLMGLAFPIGLRIWSGSGAPDDPAMARRIGSAYAVNMAGAIAGAIMGGFVLLPALGSRVSLVLAASVYLVSGALLTLVAPRPRAAWAAVGIAVAIFGGLAAVQRDPFEVTLGRRYARGEQALWREEGVQTTVAVHRAPGNTQIMYLDGLHQANDSFSMVQLHHQIGHYPMALHPDPREVLVIGLGGGATAGAVSQHAGASVEVVELSDSVVRGARLFAHVNYNVLRQPNVRLRVSDGRNHLALTSRRYDVITADIIQPQHAGAGLVYSKEYFALARAALADDGLMLQWIGHRPEVEYHLIMRTFLEVFPDATLWNGGTLLVGSTRPLTVSRAAFERKLEDTRTRQALRSVGLGSFDALMGAFSADAAAMRRLVGDGPILTDDRPRIEYHRSLPAGRREVDLSTFQGAGRERVSVP